MGPEADEWRRRWGYRRWATTDEMKSAWAAFRDAHSHATQADLEAEQRALCERFQKDEAAGVVQSAKRPKFKRRA
jgi:hypothetical protein